MWEEIKYWFIDHQGLGFAVFLSLAFVAGFLADRFLRSRSAERLRKRLYRRDEAFFKGIHYLLSNEPDQAIEQFTKSVQINSDTVETYVALGHLYRSKGDIERAIRIRQGIILRPNVDKDIKVRAILDLGLDYKKGGFLNRALSAFQKVLESDPKNIEALEQIERIYEDVYDWERAFQTRQALSRLIRGRHVHILSHHQTEIGKIQEKNGNIDDAEKSYKRAISICDRCVDAYLHLGDLYFNQQKHKKALYTWKRVVDAMPQFSFLVYQRLESAYSKIKDLREVERFLLESTRKNPDTFSYLALARHFYNKEDADSALDQLDKAINLFPSFLDVRKLKGKILLEKDRNQEALESYRDLLARLDFSGLQFQCGNCGYKQDELLWKCPQCHKWDSMNVAKSTSSGLSKENEIS